MPETALVEVKQLKKYFPIRGGLLKQRVNEVRAVDDVDLTIAPGTSFGLVGESGSGKTTLGKAVLRLIEPTSGAVIIEGQDILRMTRRELQAFRVHMQMVFQNPYSSLNPRMSVKAIVGEPLVIYGHTHGRELDERVRALLKIVGLTEDHLYRYPHEFSGGQRQRIGVARALALEPKLLVLDEPTSALDVSVQAQILNLLSELQSRLNLTYLFISHDLGVIRHICDRVALMYLGRIVEEATVNEVFEHPLHPYTQSLLASMPEPDPDLVLHPWPIEGEIATMPEGYRGCNFAPRCPFAMDRCREEDPALKERTAGHRVACHLY
ncbi:MAG: ABC transporter ATP-binding protein [Dehalococcoidia bacterium]